MEKPAAARKDEAVCGSVVEEARVNWAPFSVNQRKRKTRKSIMGTS